MTEHDEWPDDSEEYDAVVYDLDGTLVDLAVDWDAVREAVAGELAERGVDPEAGASLWDLLELAEDAGHREAADAIIADHERDGARDSARLVAADDLPASVPVGVCSLNCVEACHIALDAHGLADAIDAVVGRDSVETEKPDPEPLLATVEALGADPARTLFVGDSPRDAETAERAGVPFRYV